MTMVETGKSRCWSGLLCHGEGVKEGDQGHGGERNLLPAMVDQQLCEMLCYLLSVFFSLAIFLKPKTGRHRVGTPMFVERLNKGCIVFHCVAVT